MRTPFTPIGTTLRGALLGSLLAAGLASPFAASAQRVLWADDAQLPSASRRTTQALDRYRLVSVQADNLRAALAAAPAESGTASRQSGTVVSLPLPDGTSGRFRVVETAIMHPQLAAKFPMLRTYAAQGIDDPTAKAFIDVSPAGMHAMILSASNTVFIDPTPDGVHHLVFYKRDINRAALVSATCATAADADVNARLAPVQNVARRPSGAQLRTYRLAVAATGEYSQTKGGTTAGALAGIVATVNRVTGVYEQEVAVRFQLVANNDQLIYLNANTDPYTNVSNSATLNTNQTIVDQTIGTANYDIGHVVGTDDGGIAGLGVVCVPGNKARGTTGLPNPTGDAFDIDYVAHEIGHQFGARHTFNYDGSGSCAGGNRSSVSAYEPGGGTTIMAYAGICGAGDLQSNSDAYFHTRSYDEILTHINGTGNCVTAVNTGNRPPVVDAGPRRVIPKSTMFELTGSATDPDGDPLTYTWEQFDLGPAGLPTAATGNAPIFRSNPPSTNPTRVFPSPLRRFSNGQPNPGTPEILPSYARRLTFRLTARDNRLGGGGVEYDTVTVPVVATAGPFLVMSPNTANVVWRTGVPQTVTWDVANTTAAPINAANVDILLSTDGGATYPHVLATATPNDGSHTVNIPASAPASTQARVKIKASGSIFFDISDQNFQLQVPTAPGFYLTSACGSANPDFCPGGQATCSLSVGQYLGFTGQVNLTASNLPAGATASFTANPVAPGASSTVTISTGATTPAGTYTVTVTGTNGTQSETQQLSFTVRPSGNVPPVLTLPAANTQAALAVPTFSWAPITGATSYDLQVSTDPNFATTVINQTGLTTTQFTSPVTLQTNARYYWRVRATAACGTGPYSAANFFNVGRQVCNTVAATTVPTALTATTRSTLAIALAPGEIIADLNLKNLKITSGDIGGLIISLENPAGQRVELYSVVCNGANMDVSFDDEAAGPIACPINAGSTVRPANALGAFRGQDPNGNWTLVIQDLLGGTGTLTGWGLEVCTVLPAAARDAQQLAGVAVFPNPSTGEFNVTVDNAVRGNLSLQVTDAVGRTVLTQQVSKGAGLLQHSLDLSKLSQGVYQLRLSLPGGGTTVQKLMKL
ncbi:reprolysin-like metallopeptidase [Hymenobacter sp. B81]|uniref:reprolysin-like metallopeptidase n=1 Tax=Hymenobacter sp. B81 TaxID=3344878 RepID=UPI0037DC4869